ncbi:MAG TPA: sulfatase [Terriglobales bacterium]|nr:sulfatase [Terriglobales bacterium]
MRNQRNRAKSLEEMQKLSRVENLPEQSPAQGVTSARLLLLAASFGLITGLVEGFGLQAFHGFQWFVLNSRIPEGVSIEILWISPLVNLVFFLFVGLLLAILGRFAPRLPILRVALFLFSFMAVVDWLGLTGRIAVLAELVLAIGLATVISGRMYERSTALWAYAPRVIRGAAITTLVALLAVEGGIWLREEVATRNLPVASKSSPNVLVVLVDTLRADHLSTYGYARATSPFLTGIARQGVVFEDAVSTSSWTLPAHQSLLTGRYPHEHGPLREQPLNENYPTLAQVLDKRGYRTAAFSANNDFFCRRAGFARGFLHFEDYFYSVEDMIYRTFWGRVFFHNYLAGLVGRDELPARRTAANVNRSLLRWLDRDPDKPFFAFVNFLDIHTPYVPERPYRYKFAGSDAQAQCPSPRLSLSMLLHRSNEFDYLMGLSAECFQLQIDAYDGGISYVDDQIAALFAELARRGLDKNTLIVITSDHGESFREHGLVTHGTSLYRELVWVPLIYWWPGHIPSGMRIDRPISAASLPATIMDLLGDPDAKEFPVPSVAQLWNLPGSSPDWPYPISELAQDVYVPKQYPAYQGWLKSITDPRWHLIVTQSGATELYNYPQDPGEIQNLAESAQGKAVVDAVETQLWSQVNAQNHNKTGLTHPLNQNKVALVTK